jgi:hypothetical protein
MTVWRQRAQCLHIVVPAKAIPRDLSIVGGC